jgi:hypothetical protein
MLAEIIDYLVYGGDHRMHRDGILFVKHQPDRRSQLPFGDLKFGQGLLHNHHPPYGIEGCWSLNAFHKTSYTSWLGETPRLSGSQDPP